MKKLIALSFLIPVCSYAQIGVGTITPHSALDVRGSMATAYTSFASSTTAGSTDNLLVFTGTSAATLTLPTAAGITGRQYWIKNSSSNSSVLTIATTSSQTIDGLSSWTLTQQNKTMKVVSNGTNWLVATESLPGSTGTPWVLGGNNVTSLQNIGTTSNHSLPFITNNTEKMRLSNTGNLAIGTTTWDGSNPEKLLVDAGTTSSINVMSGKGSINNYLQLNIQNRSSGAAASSDIVATANNGNETVNYVDLGINSSGYSSTGVLGGANNAYLYSTGNDFVIGNATSNSDLLFFTGGIATTNERMRINNFGDVAIGTDTWNGTYPEKLLVDAGTTSSIYPLSVKGSMNGWFRTQMTNSSAGTSASSDFIATNNGSSFINVGINGTGYTGSGVLGGASKGYLWTSGGNDFVIGNGASGRYMAFFTGGTATTNERVRIGSTGDMAIGTTTWDGTNPEKLLVDAGTTSSINLISGKGTINNYLQLNIQNRSTGTAASSDVVATANNGNETVNYIDMGINGGGNSSTGVLGGANTAYLYATGNDFVIGNGTNSRSLVFYTTASGTGIERMEIASNGNVGIGNITPNSVFEVNGSVGLSITTTSSNITLDGTNHTVIITGGTPTVTLPAAAASNARRIYVVVNQTALPVTISTYRSFAGINTTAVAGVTSITIQSDGSNWYRIQ